MDLGALPLMIFKTGSGKETLFSEHPSCAKPKHFFHTSLLHLKITWADSVSRGAPPTSDRKLQLELSLEAVQVLCIGSQLALRMVVHPHGATQDKVLQHLCVL